MKIKQVLQDYAMMLGGFLLFVAIVLGLNQIPVYFGINDPLLRGCFTYGMFWVILILSVPFLHDEKRIKLLNCADGEKK